MPTVRSTLLFLSALPLLLLASCASAPKDFKSDMQRRITASSAGMGRGLEIMRRALHTIPPSERPAAESLLRAMTKLCDAMQQTNRVDLATLAAMPAGFPLTPAMLTSDPTLVQHRAWLAAFRKVLSQQVTTYETAVSQLNKDAAVILQRYGHVPAVQQGVRELVQMTNERRQKLTLEYRQSMALADALEPMVSYLEARKGKWAFVEKELLFLSDVDTQGYNKLAGRLKAVATSNLSGASKASASTRRS